MIINGVQGIRLACLWIHIGGCFSALIFAALAISTRKTSSWHRRWGYGYVTLTTIGTTIGFPLVMIVLLYADQFLNLIQFKKIDDFFGLAPMALVLANLWNACEAVHRKQRLSLRIASLTFTVNGLAILFCGVVSSAFAGDPALVSFRVYPIELALRHLLLLGLSAVLLARARRTASDLGWKFHHVVNILTSVLLMLRALVAGAPSRFIVGRPMSVPRVVASFDLFFALLQAGILFYYYSKMRKEESARVLFPQ